MIYLLHAFLALTTFFVVFNGFLRGAKKAQIDAVLSVILLGLLVTCFVFFGWKAGLAAIVSAFVYAIVARPLAARAAARLLESTGGPRGAYIGLPPQALARISKDLAPPDSVDEMTEELLSGSDRSERALEALLDYCEVNPDTRKIMTEFNASRGPLLDLYHNLLKAGAGQWAGGHYVPVSALAHSHTLKYLLQHPSSGRDALNQKAYNLIAHFETGSPLEHGIPGIIS